jgi:hypothetical protein
MKALRPLATVFLLASWALAARGDGGTMLLHQDAGGFTVTLFAMPTPLQVGDADLSVMVQDKNSGKVLLDPVVDLTVVPQTADATGLTVRLARGQVSNRLLQAATVHFSQSGLWRLMLLIQRGGDVAQLSTDCNVEPDRSRARLVWFYVLFPVGVILLFVIHQVLKLRSEVNVK